MFKLGYGYQGCFIRLDSVGGYKHLLTDSEYDSVRKAIKMVNATVEFIDTSFDGFGRAFYTAVLDDGRQVFCGQVRPVIGGVL